MLHLSYLIVHRHDQHKPELHFIPALQQNRKIQLFLVSIDGHIYKMGRGGRLKRRENQFFPPCGKSEIRSRGRHYHTLGPWRKFNNTLPPHPPLLLSTGLPSTEGRKVVHLIRQQKDSCQKDPLKPDAAVSQL